MREGRVRGPTRGREGRFSVSWGYLGENDADVVAIGTAEGMANGLQDFASGNLVPRPQQPGPAHRPLAAPQRQLARGAPAMEMPENRSIARVGPEQTRSRPTPGNAFEKHFLVTYYAAGRRCNAAGPPERLKVCACVYPDPHAPLGLFNGVRFWPRLPPRLVLSGR